MGFRKKAEENEKALRVFWYRFQFHIVHQMLFNFYDGIQKKASKKTFTIEEVAEQVIPYKRILLMFMVLLAFGLLIPLPSGKLDVSIWIGVLSFEGAFAIGFVAIAHWITRVVADMIPIMFSGATRAGLVKLEDGLSGGDVQSLLEMASTKERGEYVTYSAKLTVHAGLLLLGVIFIMPLAIWIPPRWQVGILVATMIWVMSLLDNMILPVLLAYNDQIWNFYSILKTEHDAHASGCHKCSKSGSSF